MTVSFIGGGNQLTCPQVTDQFYHIRLNPVHLAKGRIRTHTRWNPVHLAKGRNWTVNLLIKLSVTSTDRLGRCNSIILIEWLSIFVASLHGVRLPRLFKFCRRMKKLAMKVRRFFSVEARKIAYTSWKDQTFIDRIKNVLKGANRKDQIFIEWRKYLLKSPNIYWKDQTFIQRTKHLLKRPNNYWKDQTFIERTKHLLKGPKIYWKDQLFIEWRRYLLKSPNIYWKDQTFVERTKQIESTKHLFKEPNIYWKEQSFIERTKHLLKGPNI